MLSCVYAMMYVRIMCVLVLWARLTTVHRAHMLTHSVFTNTTCEEKQPQVHRRNRRSSNSAAGRPAAGQHISVGIRGGRQPSTRAHTRASYRESDFGSRLQFFLETSGQRRVAIIRWIRQKQCGYAHCMPTAIGPLVPRGWL